MKADTSICPGHHQLLAVFSQVSSHADRMKGKHWGGRTQGLNLYSLG